VFRGNDAIRHHMLTEGQLRSSAWIRKRYNVYADSRLDDDHALACRAAILGMPAGTVVAGPSAAYLHGIGHAAGATTDVHVITPAGRQIGHRDGVKAHRAVLLSGDTDDRSRPPRTSPTRTAWDVAGWLPLIDAVPIVDSMIGRDIVHPAELAAYASRRDGDRGAVRATRVFSLADGGAQSPPESVLRVRFVLGGLPRPVTQHPIVLPNGVTVHPDLAWPLYRVATEYDGLWHGDPDQFHLDRRRLNLLTAAGWIVLHVTSQRLHRDLDGVLREVRVALMSRGWKAARPPRS
jgi:hypothetical protein